MTENGCVGNLILKPLLIKSTDTLGPGLHWLEMRTLSCSKATTNTARTPLKAPVSPHYLGAHLGRWREGSIHRTRCMVTKVPAH